MIKFIFVSIILFYIVYLFLGILFCIGNYSKFNIKFWIKLIISWFVFIIDYLFFFLIMFKWTIWYIYHIVHDILLGFTLSESYTDTDLNKPFDEFFEDENEDSETKYYKSQEDFYDEKNFELVHFETSLFYLRVIQFVRFFYLIC